jgi:hypothetical protein
MQNAAEFYVDPYIISRIFTMHFLSYGFFVIRYGEKMYLYVIKSNGRKNNAVFKGRYNVNKAKVPSTFSCWCRTLKSKNTMGGGIKSSGGGDCD